MFNQDCQSESIRLGRDDELRNIVLLKQGGNAAHLIIYFVLQTLVRTARPQAKVVDLVYL